MYNLDKVRDKFNEVDSHQQEQRYLSPQGKKKFEKKLVDDFKGLVFDVIDMLNKYPEETVTIETHTERNKSCIKILICRPEKVLSK